MGNLDEGHRLRNRVIQPSDEVANQVTYSRYLAQVELKKIDEALQDESWITAMNEFTIHWHQVDLQEQII
jgi:hypothetical protein